MELQDLSIKSTPLSPRPVSSLPSDSPYKIRVFLIMVLMNALLNYDTGVVPASLTQIQSEMVINFQLTAGIGSSVYVGLCTASFIVSIIFQKFSASKVLLINMGLNCLFCLLFAISYNIYLIYLARFGMGFTQAFCVIYAPVWTNEFSPKHRSTQWMGLLQCAVPIGVVFGYSVASIINLLDLPYLSWRASIVLQAVLEVPLIVNFSYISNVHIDVLNNKTENCSVDDPCLIPQRPTVQFGTLSGFCHQFKILATNLTFVFLTLGLSSMFFVVSGIQYWVSLYMIEALNADPLVVLIGFVFISTTAPILGVLIGGFISDHYGGYKGDNVFTAMKICLAFAGLAFSFAVPACFIENVYAEYILLWLLFFFGACLVPSATGITVDSIEKEFQSSASSLSQFMFNFGGFFLAPVVSAAFMDGFKSRVEALTWGFKFTLTFSIGAVCFILAAYLVIHKSYSGSSDSRKSTKINKY